MRYDVTKPCANCPFRRDGFIPLHAERVEEIAEGMLSTQGASFACHKTLKDDEDGDTVITSDSAHCAGALIFAEKNDNATQMMRICERLGVYDARKLEPHHDLVFDDLDEMLEAHAQHPINRDGRRIRKPQVSQKNAPRRATKGRRR
jgi:hypothetical protein